MPGVNPEEALESFYARRRAFERCLATPQVQMYLRATKRGAETAAATCPCCGYPTLMARGGYEICTLCEWEDDGQDDREFVPPYGYDSPDSVSRGPNADYSLTLARLNFADHGHMYRPNEDGSIERRSEDADLRHRMIRLFDSLLPDVNPDNYIALIQKLKTL